MTRILLVTALLFVAFPAAGDTWLKSCRSGNTTTGLNSGQHACFDPTAISVDTPILSVGGCDPVTIARHSDKDGDTTDCTVAYTVRTCPAAGGTGTNQLNECLDHYNVGSPTQTSGVPDGLCDSDGSTAAAAKEACGQVENTTTLSANDQEAAIDAGPYIRLHTSNSGSNAADCRIVATCH